MPINHASSDNVAVRRRDWISVESSDDLNACKVRPGIDGCL